MLLKKTKKILSIIMCLVLVLTNLTFADSSSDVKGHWAEEQINSWLLKGYVKGFEDGSIKPNNEISRIEFIIMVNRAFGFTETDSVNFKDVKANDWFYSEVAKAIKAGYISGLSDGTFKPKDSISRQEAAVILSRLFKLEANADAEVLSALKDSGSIPTWSSGAISAVISKEYMKGMPDKSFMPSKKMTRAEAIVTLDRCYLDYIKATYDKAGTFTAGTVEGSIEIKAADVILQDTVINGNLIINESVGDGNVTLRNVVVKGDTVVRGGGLNSIIAESSTFTRVIINKADNKVRFVATGNTTVTNVDMLSGGKLEEQNLNSSGFGTIQITQESANAGNITLIGKFEKVDVNTANIYIDIQGEITDFNVSDNANNTSINLSLEARINNLILDAMSIITGSGIIGNADVNISNIRIDVPVTTVNLADGVTDVTTYTPPSTLPTIPSIPTTPSAPSALIVYVQECVIGVDSTMEYSTDNWTTSTDVTGSSISLSGIIPAAGSAAATLKIRLKATPSLEQTLSIPARPTTPNYSIDFVNERIASVASTDEYCADNFDIYATQSGTGEAVTLHPNSFGFPDNHIYIRKKATSSSFRSDVQHLVLLSRAEPPTLGDGTADTFMVEQASGISGTRVTAQSHIEVCIVRADDTVKVPWEEGTPAGKDFSSAVITDEVHVRVKATSTTFAGDTVSMALDPGICKAPATPIPVISGVVVPAGSYKVGDVITVTINADGTGYTAGAISFNGKDVSGTLVSADGNNYTVTYTIAEGDMDRAAVADIPISVVLYNEGTPCTAYTTAPTSAGTVTIDANSPIAFPVMEPTTASNGISGDGKSNVTIIWADSISLDINHYEVVAKVGAAPTVNDVVAGETNIAAGTHTATFEWLSEADLYVGIVAVDDAGNKTLAANATPNITVAADSLLEAGIATFNEINDLDINDDASDFQVVFNPVADESLISEYRLMVMSTGAALSFDITDAEAVASGRYIQIVPNGSSSYTVNFEETTTDIFGSVIHTGEFYKMVILSMANGTTATVNTLSAQSDQVALSPYIGIDLASGTGNEAKFILQGYGDYTDHTFAAGSADLLRMDGSVETYYSVIYDSGMYYKIDNYNLDIAASTETGDQITVTDDGTGTITISVTDANDNNSLDGHYLLDVGPEGFSNYISFVVDGASVLVVRPELERIDLGSGIFDEDTFAINYYHSGDLLTYVTVFTAGSVNLLGGDGSFQAIPSSIYSYMLEQSVSTLEAEDQITVTDDGAGMVTISVTDGGVPNTIDGTYRLWVRDDSFGIYRCIDFTVSGTMVTLQ